MAWSALAVATIGLSTLTLLAILSPSNSGAESELTDATNLRQRSGTMYSDSQVPGCSMTEISDGDVTPTPPPAISENGFGDRLPQAVPHSQHGSMRKQAVLRKILEDQNFKCALTGAQLTPDTTSLDHIIPVSRDGHPTDARNGQFLHREVNRMKGTLEMGEFIEWCRLIVKHADLA